jgi:hypothetical protein
MTLLIIDKLRIISDLSLRKNSMKKIDTLEKIAHEVQKKLDIPQDYEVAVGILSVLFYICTINGKVPIQRLKMKMGLNEITDIQEDFIYLLNNHYIEIGKYANNVEWIKITAKLYKQIWHEMTEENHQLFMLIGGKQLNEAQLIFFKSKLFNEGLDIGELFLTAVVCRQNEAAKNILEL